MTGNLVEIVERARNDAVSVDEQHRAFAELVSRFEESAFAWAFQRLDDPEEAKDAMQDAFIAAWLKLRSLRDPRAFGAWLKRLIATQCNRRRRKREQSMPSSYARHLAEVTQSHLDQRDRQRILAHAMAELPESEHRIVVLFYFLGRKIDEIAAILGIPRGTVGKRLYSARIRIRRKLPRRVREEFLFRRSSPFRRKVSEGLFDEYVGTYRFDERPERVVRIAREGALLVGYGGGQRNVLASVHDGELLSTEFDGEGRFQRDRAGRIIAFVYYEFGARLGVARRASLDRATVPACG